MELTAEELELVRQWFNCTQDLAHSDFLENADYVLAEKIYKQLGMRVPDSVHIRPNEQRKITADKEVARKDLLRGMRLMEDIYLRPIKVPTSFSGFTPRANMLPNHRKAVDM